jgi:hypothetical protein
MREVYFMKFWLNIDFPSKSVILHRESCIVCKPYSQKNKGVNKLMPNGGWYEFESIEAANALYEKYYSSFRWNECKRCFKK